MNPLRPSDRWARGLVALAVTATSTLAALNVMAGPAAAAGHPKPATTADQPKLGDACTSSDLGKRYPFIKSAQVQPTITHFKGWYVTDGSTGSQTIETSTQTVVTVQVGLSVNIQGNFQVGVLGQVGGSLGLNVQMSSSSTSSQSKSITWDFRSPGYYGLYEGTRKVTGQYGSLNCNRVDLGNGSFATKWVEGPGSGSFTTYTTLEEGAVRCEDTVPRNSIMKKAQDILGCGTAAARSAAHAPAAKAAPAPTAKAPSAPAKAARQGAKKDATGWPPGPAVPPGFTCEQGYSKIATPERTLFWSAPGFMQGDDIQLSADPGWFGNQDQWQVCRGPESGGIAEHIFINRATGKCLTIAESTASDEGSPLRQADCKTDDLQRFHVYRDVPGSDKIGVQNKFTGYMVGHDRTAEGQPVRQYSMGKPDGTGTYVLVKV
ncbi:RICIN domain-containing protein [Streptomyces sp. NPDC053048]|uniref:RICIN domain-containing protein n=1 Tax=Streptomyces sp. NPDC053048 TaxID=3365694 RepID=UPI0037D3EC77